MRISDWSSDVCSSDLTGSLDAIFPDLSGVIRGKRYPIAELGKVMEAGFALPGSVFMLDTQGESHDPDGIGFSDGDPDYQAKVIPGTLMPVPWAQRPLAQVMVTLDRKSTRLNSSH